MDDNNNVNVWGLRPHPIHSCSASKRPWEPLPFSLQRQKLTTFIDTKMQQTLEENLDIYIKNIHNEDTDNFWTWFMDMWAKRFLQCFTASWESYDTKEEIDHYNCLVTMEANHESDTGMSAPSEELVSSSSSGTVPSDVVGTDDRHNEQGTDAIQRKQAGWELHRKAVTRITAWCAVILATGIDPTSEWESLDVDTWVEVTGYDGKQLVE
ncbi:hypothetical protein EDD85DRAFT_958035 [Armillaria nabsnona]|nr:hypothetical protein EDD85DRAFT_958035 [Armillaria nabsnona]